MSINTALAVRDPVNLNETKELAQIFAQSGFFTDSRQMAQAVTKIMAGRELGFGPIASMSGVFIINNRIALSATLMAAKVQRTQPYGYRVVTLNDEVCNLEFLEHGKVAGNSVFTMADARRAGTKNMDKFPRNMLFARAMSNGVRWFCPDVLGGSPVYTPEELGAEIDEDGKVLSLPPGTVIHDIPPTDNTNEPSRAEVSVALEQAEKVLDEAVPHPDTTRPDGTYEQGALDYKLQKGQVYVNILIDPSKPSGRAWALASKTIGQQAKNDRERIEAKVQSLFVYDKGPNAGHNNPWEMENHIKKHFQKGTVASLTFEELAALLTWKLEQVADERWYADKEAATPISKAAQDPAIQRLAELYGVTELTPDATIFLGSLARMPDPMAFKDILYTEYGWSWQTHASELDALSSLVDVDPDIAVGSPQFKALVESYQQPIHDNAH